MVGRGLRTAPLSYPGERDRLGRSRWRLADGIFLRFLRALMFKCFNFGRWTWCQLGNVFKLGRCLIFPRRSDSQLDLFNSH